MEPSSIEASFQSFQRSGDPEALGRVFDVVAPKLLLLAGHLATAHHDAEDLVQSTFIEVIHHRDRWSSERPLLPWICGILANLARRQRRRHPQRELSQQPPQPPNTDSVIDDPALLAESKESFDQLVAMIDRMEPIYRQSLTLRVVHGMSNTEIAHTLGEPVETIRTRLHRGIQRMREAVPSNASVSLVALIATVGARESLGSVRGAVLAAATPTTASLTHPLVLGYLMSRTTAIAAGLLLLSAFSWLWFQNEPSPITASPHATSDPPNAPKSLPDSAPRPAAIEPVRAEPVAQETGEDSAPRTSDFVETEDPAGWQVHGRISTFGEPIVGARIYASVDQIPDALDIWATSDASGEYSISLDDLKDLNPTERVTCSVTLDVVAETYQPAIGIVTEIPKETHVPFDSEVSINVYPGAKVVGRLVTTSGEPVVGANIELEGIPPEGKLPEGETPERTSNYGTSRQNGLFEVGVWRSCEHSIFIARDDRHGRAKRDIQVSEENETVDLGDVVLHPAATIGGRMLLSDRSPLDNFIVYPKSADKAIFRTLTTDAEGQFWSQGLEETISTVEVHGAFMDPQAFPVEPGVTADHVVEGCLLILRATDATGELLPKMKFDFRAWAADQIPPGFKEGIDTGPPPSGACLYQGSSFMSGEFRLLLPPGAAVYCNTGHAALGHKSIGIRLSGPAREVRNLSFSPVVADAKVHLTVVDDVGAPLTNYTAQLFTSTGFFPSQSWLSKDPKGGTGLSPGGYRLRVTSTSHEATYLPFETALVLKEGEARAVHAITPRGGHLRLRIGDALEGLGEGASISVFGPTGTPAKHLFWTDGEANSLFPTSSPIIAGALLKGSAALPLGPHRVVLSRADYPDLERSVEILAGTTSELTIP